MVETDVASRAYAYWLARGRPQGSELEDWLRAESELSRFREITRQLHHVRRQFHSLEDLSETQLARLWQTEADLRRSECARRALLSHTLDAAFAVDRLGFIIEVNPAAEALFHCRAEQLLHQPVEQGLPPSEFRRLLLEFTAECAMFDPQPVIARRFETTARRADGSEFPVEVSLAPSPPVRPTMIVAFVRDQSGPRLALRHLRAEHAVAAAIADSCSVAEAAPRLLEALGHSLGQDAATLWRVLRNSGRFQCLSLWREQHVPANVIPTDRPCTVDAGQSLFGRTTINRQPVWISNLSSSPHFAGRGPILLAGLRSAIAFPIGDAGGEIGMIELFSRQTQQPDPETLATLASIGGQVAQFFERRQAEARLSGWEHEAELARAIQQGLLPHTRLSLAQLEFGGHSAPAQLTGGDFFDYFPFPDGTFAVAIGDASGHGIAASLLIAETRAYLRALTLTHLDVGQILTLINQRLAEDTLGGSFVTMFLCRLDPVSRRVVYSNAGHWPAIVLNDSGEVRARLASTNIPLSLDPACAFNSAEEITLHPGDLVFLFTDGILDAFGADRSLFGLKRAIEHVRTHRHLPPDEIIATLFDEVLKHSGHVLVDDISALIIKVRPDSEPA